jgi:hypothetical protein
VTGFAYGAVAFGVAPSAHRFLFGGAGNVINAPAGTDRSAAKFKRSWLSGSIALLHG